MLTLISQNTETWIQCEITQRLRTSFLWKLEFSYAVLNKLRGFLTLVLSDTVTPGRCSPRRSLCAVAASSNTSFSLRLEQVLALLLVSAVFFLIWQLPCPAKKNKPLQPVFLTLLALLLTPAGSLAAWAQTFAELQSGRLSQLFLWRQTSWFYGISPTHNCF